MDYAALARQTRANLEKKPVKAPGVSTGGIDPRAWLSEIGGTIGGIGGGLLGGPAGAAAGAAGGTALGKVLEQKVKGEAIKPMDVATEAGLSALFAYGPVRAAKGVLGMGTKAAAQPVAAGAVKGAFTKPQREGIDFVGRAWGLHPGAKLMSGGKEIGLTKANQLQNFARSIGAGKNFAAIDVQDIAEQYAKNTGKKIATQLSTVKAAFSVDNILSQLDDAYKQVYGAKPKELVKNLRKAIKDTKGNYTKLWDVRKNVDKQIINFNKGVDAASTSAQEVASRTRTVINKVLKEVTGIADDFSNYNKASDILTLVGPQVRSPKGSVIPGTGLRVLGKTTQRGQALTGNTIKQVAGIEGRVAAPKAAPSLLQTARGQAARQAVAAGLRTAVTPPQPGTMEITPTATQLTGLEGMLPTTPAATTKVDPRLNAIRKAVVQDIAKTGGKNLKNIQTIAGVYGIDLTPLGLQPTTAAKTGFAALTADQQKRVANLNTVSAALNNLEQSVAQSGFFPQEPQALSTLLGPGRRVIGGAISPEQRQYMASLRSRGIQIIRALGEVGNLSASEQEAAIKILPQPGDNARTAALKISQLRALFSDVAQRVASPQIGTFQ